MAYDYDIEAAKQKLPPAIETVDQHANVRTKQVIDEMREVAKLVNADKLTRIVETGVEYVEADAKMYNELLGQDGDTMHDGTLKGALKGIKDIDAAMN